MSMKSRSANDVRRVVRFAVNRVKPAADRIWSEPLSRSLARRCCRDVLLVPGADQPVINSAVDLRPETVSDHDMDWVGSGAHPLIDAVGTALRALPADLVAR